MKNLLTIVLLLSIGTLLAAPDNKPARTKKPATPTAAPVPTPISERPALKPEPAPTQKNRVVIPQSTFSSELSPMQIDSLMAEWREQQTLSSFDNFFTDYINLDPRVATGASSLPDSVYVRRLRDLASPVFLPYNYVVKGYINRYTDTRYGTINRILSLSQYYFPLIEEELIKAGLPVELRAVAIIESALTPTAISHSGAVGLWQFMPATGKAFGLEINSLIDERRNPILSTRAACRYLRDLYKIFNNWSLAIAAYNCGPGNVNKAIARAGGRCESFWDIYDYLPTETRGYVPAFIGASYAYAYHHQHGIKFAPSPLPLATDTIRVNRLMHFKQISSTINLPIETLRQLNPQYKLDIIPATTKPYTLVLPQRYISQYIQKQDSIFAKDSMYLKEYINPANFSKLRTAVSSTKTVAGKPAVRVTYYTVKRGDTLGAIAKRHGVTMAQLIRWNHIRDVHKVVPGQKLRIEGK